MRQDCSSRRKRIQRSGRYRCSRSMYSRAGGAPALRLIEKSRSDLVSRRSGSTKLRSCRVRVDQRRSRASSSGRCARSRAAASAWSAKTVRKSLSCGRCTPCAIDRGSVAAGAGAFVGRQRRWQPAGLRRWSGPGSLCCPPSRHLSRKRRTSTYSSPASRKVTVAETPTVRRAGRMARVGPAHAQSDRHGRVKRRWGRDGGWTERLRRCLVHQPVVEMSRNSDRAAETRDVLRGAGDPVEAQGLPARQSDLGDECRRQSAVAAAADAADHDLIDFLDAALDEMELA